MSKYVVKAKKYKVQDDDSIKSIADANRMTWQELAKFNWGTAEPNKINKFLRDKVGCRKKTRDGKNYMFTSKDEPGILYIPEDMDPKSFQASTENTLKVEIPNYKYEDCTIKGVYVHKHMEDLAERLSESVFIALLAPIFGKDIPGCAYRDLYRKYSLKSFPEPKYEVVKDMIKDKDGVGHVAAYDKGIQTIKIFYELVDNAISEEVSSLDIIDDDSILFAVLAEEYGHYIDDRLRNEFSRVEGDAKDDEGAKFAYKLTFFEPLSTVKLHYADVNHPSYSGPLHLDFTSAQSAINEYTGPSDQLDNDVYNNSEFFGARTPVEEGDTHHDEHAFDHYAIEEVLIDVGFTERERLQIYFGNWLRDFSQVVDPAIVRPDDAHAAKANNELWRTMDFLTVALFAFKQSRRTLTSLVAFLAVKEFGEEDFELAKELHDLLMGPKGLETLGAYRPQEHIDNPLPKPLDEKDKWRKNQLIDPIFPPPPTEWQLEINRETGLKNYIATANKSKQAFEPAIEYMISKLKDAKNAGKTSAGFRFFGEALHVLEDFFAHSNFCELSLIKAGYPVYPWVEDYEKIYYQDKLMIPLVTGSFYGVDILGSILPKFAEMIPHFEKPFKEEPGKLTPEDLIMLVFMQDLDKAQEGDTFEPNPTFRGLNVKCNFEKLFRDYLALRDLYFTHGGPILKFLYDLNKHTIEVLLLLIEKPLYSMMRQLADTVDDFQTWLNSDVGTNPHHTQVAKDDEDSPLHLLAGELAKIAVKDVGAQMHRYMNGDSSADPVGAASKYFVHPLHSDLLDEHVKSWALSHKDKVTRARYKTEEDYERAKKHMNHIKGRLEESTNKIHVRIKSSVTVFSTIYSNNSLCNPSNNRGEFRGY